MGQPRFEVPSGAVDGVNTVFTVSVPYVPGSTAVWINGVLLERTLDDGWVESDPLTGEVTLKEAPRAIGHGPDVIQVFFQDTSDDLPEVVISEIVGTVEMEATLSGTMLQVENVLIGSVGVQAALSGTLSDDVPSQLQGVLEPVNAVVGVIYGEECL